MPPRFATAVITAPPPTPLHSVIRLLAAAVLAECVLAPVARAGDCAVVESRSSLAALSGTRITSLDVQSDAPSLPAGTGWAAFLHPVSREAVLQRQLLFAVGDTVDTLRVGETMRRLRAQRLFADAIIIARRCDAIDGVGLTVHTRDTWTFRPTARLRSSNQLSVGVEDRNFLGTGRTVALTREMTLRGSGAAISLTDPFVLGSNVAANLRVAKLAAGHTLRVGARLHEYSVFDAWKVEANLARISFGDTVVADKPLHTISAMTMVGRRVFASERGATLVLVGAEFDSAASLSPTMRQLSAPGMPHLRSFLGVDLGLQRRTAQFDTASWIVPGRGFLDVPLGWEGEGIVAVGRERDVQTTAVKYDWWLGRVWIPRRGQVLMLDGWASAYLGRGVDRNQISRTSMSFYSAAARGMWGFRITAEQLAQVDPDRRALSLMPLADLTSPLLRSFNTRAGEAVAASLDRDMRLLSVGANSVLNIGGYVASSYRWNVENLGDGHLHASVVGARLRLLSANGTVSSIRMDVGFPVMRSDVLPSRPFLILTYGTLFDASRQRDGRRSY